MHEQDSPPDLKKALAEIGDIRSTLAAGTIFQGFGPVVIAMTGGLSVLTATAQTAWPLTFAPDAETFLACWIVTAVVAALLVGVEMLARSRRLHGGLSDAMLISAIEHFLPAGVAGATIAAVLYKYAPEQLWLLPGLWQMLVALGVFTAARTLPRAIHLVAGWYFVAGTCALILSSQEQQMMPWAMGLPFAIGQFIMAGVLHYANEEATDV